MKDNLTTNASNKAESPAFLVGAVSGQLPTNEEIDLIIEQDLPFSKEYQKYPEKEKVLSYLLAAQNVAIRL